MLFTAAVAGTLLNPVFALGLPGTYVCFAFGVYKPYAIPLFGLPVGETLHGYRVYVEHTWRIMGLSN